MKKLNKKTLLAMLPAIFLWGKVDKDSTLENITNQIKYLWKAVIYLFILVLMLILLLVYSVSPCV